MSVTVLLTPDPDPVSQEAFLKIAHEITVLRVWSEGESDYEVSFLPHGMSSLEYLYCENNRLTTLSPIMSGLRGTSSAGSIPLPNGMCSLRTLYCYNNQLLPPL